VKIPQHSLKAVEPDACRRRLLWLAPGAIRSLIIRYTLLVRQPFGFFRLVTGVFFASLWFAFAAIRAQLELRAHPDDLDVTYRFSNRMSRGFTRILGLRHRVRNPERLLPPCTSVFVANHRSNLDVITVSGVFPRRAIVVAKKELRKVPFLGPFLVRSNNILLDRSDSEESKVKMKHAEHLLVEKGINIFLFPEGTRNHGEMRPFKKGAFHLAMNTSAPLVPIVCATTRDWINPGKLWKAKRVDVFIDVLEPLDPRDYPTADALRDETQQRMRARLTALEEEISAQARS